MNAGKTIAPTPGRGTYGGLFLIALATLMFEILLTRIFSVTMWYHFAFVAISVAMFGMTVGAILVYLLPHFFTREALHRHLAAASLLFAVAVVMSFLTHISVPFVAQRNLASLYSLALTYVAIATPFVASGVAVSLSLTRFPASIGRLYATDLAGAALGCLLLVGLLAVADGPSTVFLVAALGCLAALCFAWAEPMPRMRRLAFFALLIFGGFGLINAVTAHWQAPLLRLQWVKGRMEEAPLFEAWNSYSRLAISGNPDELVPPFGWGMSARLPDDMRVRQLHLTIDAAAATKLTRFTGDLDDLEFLKYDVVNIAHHLRSNSRSLVVGVGGGRDVLSALAFSPDKVTGVEINSDIVRAVNQQYGDFTGHLDADPRVEFVVDEARSYATRSAERFDVIQVSLIDTWAATAAGAFVLSENSLYTLEAWETFLRRLEPDGVLTFSRWYFPAEPAAIYRLGSLAVESLQRLGVEQPRLHVVVIRNQLSRTDGDNPEGVGTILVSPTPFAERDLDVLDDVAASFDFEIMQSPRVALDPTLDRVVTGRDTAFVSGYPLKIEAPTDDSPFFFHMLRLESLFDRELSQQGRTTRNQQAVYILAALLLIVTVLTLLCIIAPIAAVHGIRPPPGSLPYLLFFGGIGFGFMLIEISQMQRLNIFLGHPTYGLTVVLFTVLLASGAGSFITQSRWARETPNAGSYVLATLLLVLLITGLVTPGVIDAFRGQSNPVRIAISALLLVPMGLLMGMPFPLGMRLGGRQHGSLTPWFWGINGATSVCASVLAMAIALFSQISTSYWVGFACYLLASLAYLVASRHAQGSDPAAAEAIRAG